MSPFVDLTKGINRLCRRTGTNAGENRECSGRLFTNYRLTGGAICDNYAKRLESSPPLTDNSPYTEL